MKKFIVLSVVFVIAAVSNVQAQRTSNNGGGGTTGKVQLQDFHFADGQNTIKLDGGASIKVVKRGDKFVDATYIDAAGKTTRLIPSASGTNGAPQPSCKYPIPDACFGTADKNIGMCICKPTDLSSGNYGVSLLLPAVQKVREAAN